MSQINFELACNAEDEVACVKLLRKAAEQGHVLAQHELGCTFHMRHIAFDERGIRIFCESKEKDIKLAVKWYSKSAKQGYAPSQFNLGEVYRKEPCVKDFSNAIHWYQKAAEQGHAYAQFALGMMYIGQGVPDDEMKAKEWIGKAAKQLTEFVQDYLYSWYRMLLLGKPEDEMEENIKAFFTKYVPVATCSASQLVKNIVDGG